MLFPAASAHPQYLGSSLCITAVGTLLWNENAPVNALLPAFWVVLYVLTGVAEEGLCASHDPLAKLPANFDPYFDRQTRPLVRNPLAQAGRSGGVARWRRACRCRRAKLFPRGSKRLATGQKQALQSCSSMSHGGCFALQVGAEVLRLILMAPVVALRLAALLAWTLAFGIALRLAELAAGVNRASDASVIATARFAARGILFILGFSVRAAAVRPPLPPPSAAARRKWCLPAA